MQYFLKLVQKFRHIEIVATKIKGNCGRTYAIEVWILERVNMVSGLCTETLSAVLGVYKLLTKGFLMITNFLHKKSQT